MGKEVRNTCVADTHLSLLVPLFVLLYSPYIALHLSIITSSLTLQYLVNLTHSATSSTKSACSAVAFL